MIVDTHAHLYYPELKNNLDNVIQNAINIGIEKIIIPAVNFKTSIEVIEISEKYEILYSAVGIHPTEVKNSDRKNIKQIEKLLNHPKVVAIGEIGLDYYWDKNNIEEQKHYFNEQLSLAKNNNLPVIIHTRNSLDDTIEILQVDKFLNVKGQFHCFSGNKHQLEEIKRIGNFYISFGGNITYKNYRNLDLIRSVPLDKLLFETDSPFMAPVPVKNKINEPSNITYTILKLSELTNVEYNLLTSTVYNNTNKLFKRLKV